MANLALAAKKATGKAATKAAAQPDPQNTPIPVPPPPPSAADIQHQLVAKYGHLGALLDNADTLAVLQRAINDPQQTDDETLAQLYNTPYFKTVSAAQRQFEEMQHSDPASLNVQIQAKSTQIVTEAQKSGVELTGPQTLQLATDAVKFGWDAPTTTAALAAQFNYQPGKQRGNVGVQEGSIKKMAADYLVPLSNPTLAEWDRQVAAGTASADTFKQYIVDQAKLRFPALANHLDNMTTQFLVDPYKQTAAQELGINPDTIDFSDPKWMRPLNVMDDKGNSTLMSTPDWIKTIRSDPTYGWDRSQNGVQSGYALGNVLSQAMGLRR